MPTGPKDPAQLDQERAQAFQAWLDAQLASGEVERTPNLADILPSGF